LQGAKKGPPVVRKREGYRVREPVPRTKKKNPILHSNKEGERGFLDYAGKNTLDINDKVPMC